MKNMKMRLIAAIVAVMALFALTTSPAHAVYRQAMCVPGSAPAQVNLHVTTWIDTNNPNYAVYHIDMDSYPGYSQSSVYFDGRKYTKTNDLYVHAYGRGISHTIKGFWWIDPDFGVTCSVRLSPW